jgi:hypothetical protein
MMVGIIKKCHITYHQIKLGQHLPPHYVWFGFLQSWNLLQTSWFTFKLYLITKHGKREQCKEVPIVTINVAFT